jgi:hypothetical protein
MPCFTLIARAACKWVCESSLTRANHSTRSSSACGGSIVFDSQQQQRLCLRHVAFTPCVPMWCTLPSDCPSGVKNAFDPLSTTPKRNHLERAATGGAADDEAAEAVPHGAVELEAVAEDLVAFAVIGTPSSKSLPDSSATTLWSFSSSSRRTSCSSIAAECPIKPERFSKQDVTPN